MKIVQSFWSKPIYSSFNQNNHKHFGGWRYKKYSYMSWALSCLTFKKNYNNIELVTDLQGKKLLIDTLQLPFSNVRVELDSLNRYPEQLWAVGKLYSYALQEEPFIHVDNDIFIWSRFPKKIETADLVAQNTDLIEPDYQQALQHLTSHDIELPLLLKKDYELHNKFNSSNAGIIGGNNVDFFKEYSKRSFEFIHSNLSKVNKNIIGSSFAIIYEQYLYCALARKYNIEICHLFSEEERRLVSLPDFINKYNSFKYTHCYSISKHSIEICRELEHQLLLDYPEYYERINWLIENE